MHYGKRYLIKSLIFDFIIKQMEWIPIFFGVFIAIAVYAHFITKYNEHEDKLKNAVIETDKDVENEAKNNNGSKSEKSTTSGNKKRFCPLCGSELKIHESLYAEMYEGTPRPKVIIHGCKNCYIPSGKKTDFDVKKVQEEN